MEKDKLYLINKIFNNERKSEQFGTKKVKSIILALLILSQH